MDENGFDDAWARSLPKPANWPIAAPVGSGPSYAVVYVRPETNNVLYERAIVAAVRKQGQLVYLANLNGAIFQRDRILERHYSSQFRFARDPRGQLARYPEIAERVTRHFKLSLEAAPLIGGFDAVEALSIPADELFGTILTDADFLNCYGQEFKRIGESIVVNPHLPAIVQRYTPQSNVFTLVVRLLDRSAKAFEALNHAIYVQVTASRDTPVLDEARLQFLDWAQRIRRTYHVSANHLMAAFDMSDLVYVSDTEHLDMARTPLGRWLVDRGAASAERLRELQDAQLAYLGSERTLEYLPKFSGASDQDRIAAMVQGPISLS